MVAIDSIPTQNTEIMVKHLFKNSHRYTSDREAKLLWWTSAEAKESTFLSSFKFLSNVWSDKNFRPFDNVHTSTLHLQQHPDQDFIIRLSTSHRGGITLTFRRSNDHSKIVHTRFHVNSESKIVDPNGNEHSSISTLAHWFSTRASSKQNSPATPAGYVCTGSL